MHNCYCINQKAEKRKKKLHSVANFLASFWLNFARFYLIACSLNKAKIDAYVLMYLSMTVYVL